MKGIIFLIILIFIYYQINKRYPDNLSIKSHIYFSIFIILTAAFFYMVNYQSQFANLESQIANVKSKIKNIKIDINNTKITSPFEGIINNLKYMTRRGLH